ncbi:MAG: hypothetical protein IKB16_16070 [Lentisphaeria bacterium]|nr:hypothetical protein [Lentisphaeria bacterium]
MKQYFTFFCIILMTGLTAADIPGIPRDSNINNSSWYDSTRVHAQLLVDVKEQTRVVHFIRDNNDPRVITKAYLIRHVDAYEIRDYLRQIVQSKRVGNTSMQQQFPSNTTTTPVTATVSSPMITEPVNAQPTYTPPAQLGSNTAVECLKYVDGTGLLIVSAEEYRFDSNKNGMGIDEIVKFLDKPQMGFTSGSQTYFYIPKFVPARNLMPLIQNVGMNISDVTELWQGSDLVAYDPDLNWLIFDVANYSMKNIDSMLAKYDVPIPQVRLKIKLCEIDIENDRKLGLDFQAWKNNGGLDFFSAGGRFRDNWAAAYGGTMLNTGSERTRFFNFNPKWNTRYIDFLFSSGKAKVIHTAEMVLRNNTSATLDRTTQVFYMDTQTPANNTVSDPARMPYKLLSTLIDRFITTADDIPVYKDNQVNVAKVSGFGFTMKVNQVSVNQKETRFTISAANSSLLGFQSTGVPRISSGNVVTLDISLPHGANSFVIGGLKKQETVTSKTGLPWLVNIPYVGYLFGTESKSVKTTELFIMGECMLDIPQNKEPKRKAKTKERKKG